MYLCTELKQPFLVADVLTARITTMTLPPGQKAIDHFPRFGLPQYADRFPSNTSSIELKISGDLSKDFVISAELAALPRVDQVSDFHCVTTWSKYDLKWEGIRFRDFYTKLIVPHIKGDITEVVLKAQDGYSTSLPLEDLLKDNVLLADKLNGAPLTIEHGAPIRVVAPNHYGYKNPKHVNRLSFHKERQSIKSGLAKIIDHSRARVQQEERAVYGPGWLYRFPYKIGIKSTIRDFQIALDKYLNKSSEQ